jgi:hypothetical protein
MSEKIKPEIEFASKGVLHIGFAILPKALTVSDALAGFCGSKLFRSSQRRL